MQFDELAVLVKPASGLCNMACTYCFYRDAAHTRGIMPDATVQALLENVFAHTRRSVTFAFQGGEPTLAGLDFYRRFVERVEAQRPADMTVSYALQTNGIALDEAWASFLAENRFLVGLSVDGTASIHDKYRQTPNGAGTYLQVRQAAEALQAAGVEFNILTVVTKDLCRQAKKDLRRLQTAGLFLLPVYPLSCAGGGAGAAVCPDAERLRQISDRSV